MTASEILPLLSNVHARGRERWIAQCPAHEDRNPSLAITQKSDRVLMKCWTGCNIKDIVAAIDIELRDLFRNGGPAIINPLAQQRHIATEELEAWRQRQMRTYAEDLRT